MGLKWTDPWRTNAHQFFIDEQLSFTRDHVNEFGMRFVNMGLYRAALAQSNDVIGCGVILRDIDDLKLLARGKRIGLQNLVDIANNLTGFIGRACKSKTTAGVWRQR